MRVKELPKSKPARPRWAPVLVAAACTFIVAAATPLVAYQAWLQGGEPFGFAVGLSGLILTIGLGFLAAFCFEEVL